MSNRRKPRRRVIADTGRALSAELRGCECSARVEQRHVGGTVVAVLRHKPSCPARQQPPFTARGTA